MQGSICQPQSVHIDADHAQRPDAFGRSAYAERLVPVLCRQASDETIVVGLEGEWGSGKTHLLGQVRFVLAKSHPDAVIVEFNPWLVANAESLVLALLGQLAARIGTTSSRSDQAQRGLLASRRILGYLSALQRVAEPALLLVDPGGTATGMVSAARASIDTMSKAVDDVMLPTRLAKMDVFARKQAVTEALQDFGRPIVIIIDDLDRLQGDEIRSIFQAIKAVADFPGISYLLAYDPKRVAKAFDDDHFVEKIVQAAYPIPHLHPWDMAHFAKQEIQNTLTALGCNMLPAEAELFHKATRVAARLCRHPRHVVRLCNRLRIAVPAIRQSITSVDIVVAEALAQACPQITEAMRRYPSDFTFLPHPRDDEETENKWVAYFAADAPAKESHVAHWQKHVPDDADDKEFLCKALDFLFGREPKLATDTSSSHARRLRVPELLAEYVRLSPVEGIPSPGAISDILSSPQRFSDAIEDAGNDVATNLLDWIAKYFPQQPLPDPAAILDRLLALAGQTDISNPAQVRYLVGHIALYLIKSSLPSQRELLMRALIDGSSLHLSRWALMAMAKEHGKARFGNREDYLLPVEQRFIADAAVASSLIEQWRDKLRAAVQQGSLIDEPAFGQLLLDWHLLGSPSYAELWQLTKSLCGTEKGLERFVGDFANGAEDWKWSHSFTSFLHLVWDCNELISRLEGASFADRFTQLRQHLSGEGAATLHAGFREVGMIADDIALVSQQ